MIIILFAQFWMARRTDTRAVIAHERNGRVKLAERVNKEHEDDGEANDDGILDANRGLAKEGCVEIWNLFRPLSHPNSAHELER